MSILASRQRTPQAPLDSPAASGLFWRFSPAEQRSRIRELAARELSIDMISQLTGWNSAAVLDAIEGRS